MKFPRIILIFFVPLLWSCKHNSESRIIFQEVAEYDMNNKYQALFYLSQTVADNSQIHFVELMQMKIIIFDMKNVNIKESKFEGRGLRGISYINPDGDTIYSFADEFSTIVLKDRNGIVLDSCKIPIQYTPFPSTKFFPQFGNRDMIVGNTSKTIPFQKEDDRKLYYKKVESVLRIQIQDSSFLFSTLGKFPQEYVESGINYNDHMPSACFGDNGSINISFGAHHDLFKYKDTILVLEKKVKSKYIDEFKPYPDDKLYDMLFLKTYSIEEPRYTNLIYDCWNKLYYRTVIHRSHFDDRAKKRSQSNWSIIITDEDFNILDELVFDYSFSPKVFVPTKEGVLLYKSNLSSNKNSVLKLYKIEKNE